MPLPIPGRIADLLRRSTVQIKTGNAGRESHGSGVVLYGDRIVTNAHVAGSGAHVNVETWEGRTIEGTVIGLDRRRDLALVSAPGHRSPALSLGDSDLLRPGTPIIAVGNPMGFVGAASSGIVHRLGGFRGRPGGPWVMADLRLAPGNSGGPLANFQGEVVGINTMVMAMAGSTLALAIPSRTVGRFLAESGVGRALGVSVRPVRMRNGVQGVMLMEIAVGSAAEQASLLAGDILVEGNGRPLLRPEDLEKALDDVSANLLRVHFYRGSPHLLREVVVAWNAKKVPNAA